ncbi:MAG: vanadium-dependent haloperoxidase [Pseudomonadota bacterium]|nr:vanadium-dependent haloperoxidase [Pseudomonadota bacterium]
MKNQLRLLAIILLALAASTVAARTSLPIEAEPPINSEALGAESVGHESLLGPNYSAQTIAPVVQTDPVGSPSMQMLLRWNAAAIDASGLDHTPLQPGEFRVFGEQLGPARASRAMAIVHIAMFEAINAIDQHYASYAGIAVANPSASMDAAIVQSAHDTLVALFPSQRAKLDRRMFFDVRRVRDSTARTLGIELGAHTAQAILAMRANDGSAHAEMRMDQDYVPSTMPGIWRQDPISQIPLALGARWQEVRPFVIASAQQFRIPPPPAMGSAQYTAAFNEVKSLGGDGITTPTQRTPEQTEIGIYWAYDGTPSLCAPPRLYNQIARLIAAKMGSNLLDTARLLALVNTAMADAGLASWESKYHYSFWRPIGGLREADVGTGPSGLGDNNPDTHGDATFKPLGAPASNLNGPNFTPPFPAYPSGHATFGGALFHTLRLFYGRDDIPFTFVSDEFTGATIGNDGLTRPLLPRSFTTLSQAEEENGQSRIYLGIHWSFDKSAGITQGRQIAEYIYQRAFQPLP